MAAPDPVLIGVRGSNLPSGSKLELASKHREYVIGTGGGSDVVVDAPSESGPHVSRRHFTVRFASPSWIVVRAGSRSGAKLLVSKVVVDNSHILNDGDEIELEGLPFRVVFKSKNVSKQKEKDRLSVRVNHIDKNQQEFNTKLKEMEKTMKKTQKELKEAQETLASVLKDVDNQKSSNDEIIKVLRDDNEELRNQLKRRTSSSGGPDVSKKSKDNSDMFNEELTCSVCSELFVDAMSLECGHLFCSYCINEWQVAKPNVTCPNCRKAVTSFHPVPTVDNIVKIVVDGSSDQVKSEREKFIRDRQDQVEVARRRRNLGMDRPAPELMNDGVSDVEGGDLEDYRSSDEWSASSSRRNDDEELRSEEGEMGNESEEEEEGGGASHSDGSTDFDEEEEGGGASHSDRSTELEEEEEEEEEDSNSEPDYGDCQTSFSSNNSTFDDDSDQTSDDY